VNREFASHLRVKAGRKGNQKKKTMENTIDKTKTTLKLEINSDKKEYTLGADINARIVLTNIGNEPVLVNGRLSMGYEDSLDREIYCRVSRDGRPYTGHLNWRVDYHRKRLTEGDFERLPAGKSREKVVNLQEWYHLDAPGNYEFQVFYAPERDENPNLPLLGEVTGKIAIVVT
jgi:hypothetical protein